MNTPAEPERTPQGAKTLDEALDQLSESSVVALRPLVEQELAPGEYAIGSRTTRRYIEVDETSLNAIRLFDGKRSIGEIRSLLTQQTNEDWNLRPFVIFLARRELVASIDSYAEPAPPQEPHGVLRRVPTRAVSWLHHPALAATVLALVGAWVGALVAAPEYRPSYADLFALDRPLASFLLVAAALVAMAYVHELAHYFMSRSFGIDAKIRFSHRILMLVMETDVTNAWLLPKRQRLKIFLAGIGFNLAMASSIGLTTVYLVESGHLSPNEPLAGVLRMLVIANLVPLVFQLFIFSRTDLYYAFACLLGERNLAGDTRAYWSHAVKRPLLRAAGAATAPCPVCTRLMVAGDPFCFKCGADSGPLAEGGPRLRPSSLWRLRLFGPVVGLGYLFASMMIFFIVPRLVMLIFAVGIESVQLAHFHGNFLLLLEAVAFLLLNLLQLGYFGWILLRKVTVAGATIAGVARNLLAPKPAPKNAVEANVIVEP